jgi:hypothetical protein
MASRCATASWPNDRSSSEPTTLCSVKLRHTTIEAQHPRLTRAKPKDEKIKLAMLTRTPLDRIPSMSAMMPMYRTSVKREKAERGETRQKIRTQARRLLRSAARHEQGVKDQNRRLHGRGSI